MTDEEFEIMVAKSLAGEMSLPEQAQLDALLARDAQRRTEFAELQAAWAALRECGPLTSALDAPPTPLPQHRVGELKSVVRRHFSTRARERPGASSTLNFIWLWLNAHKAVSSGLTVVVLLGALFAGLRVARDRSSEVLAYLLPIQGEAKVERHGQPVAMGAAAALQRGDVIHLSDGAFAQAITPSGPLSIKGPQRVVAEKLGALAGTVRGQRLPNRSAAPFQSALFRPLKQLLAARLLTTTRDGQGLSLYSPRDATLSLAPLILWKAEPGKTYDVTIRDEFDRGAPPWELRGAMPPVHFEKVEGWKNRPLMKDGLYRIQIRESGNALAAVEHTFRTLKDANGTRATSPADKIARAYQLLTLETPAPGDALAELLTLPPELGEAEIVLRLKLALFGQLGLAEEYSATAMKLTKANHADAKSRP